MTPNLVPYVAPAASFVHASNGLLTTTSVQVAEFFGRTHKDVLKALERMECSVEFRRLNYQPTTYKDSRGKVQPMVVLTKDGFMFLAMGFTGPRAAQIKEAYMEAFNYMAREANARETDAISRLQRELINAQKRAVKAERGWRVALQAQLRLAQRTLLKPQMALPGQMTLAGV